METLNGNTSQARRIYRAVMVEGKSLQDAGAAEGMSGEQALSLIEPYAVLCEESFVRAANALKSLPVPLEDAVNALFDFAESVFGVKVA